MKATLELRPSVLLTATAMNTVLYAVLSYATAYIQSPWGSGQFRPAVVVPALFATIFGPMPGGIGAALGTLIADSVKHGQLYPGSLLAAVPGNFIGFYLFGYIMKKKFNWERFILTSQITLVIANLIVAFLYVFLFKVLYLGQSKYVSMPLDVQVFFSLGLTIWWYITMLPFVLLVTPILIRAVSSAFPSFVSNELRENSLGREIPEKSFSLALLVPGIVMLLFAIATSYTGLGVMIHSFFGGLVSSLVQLMFYLSGIALSVLGGLFYSRKILSARREETGGRSGREG
jgi:hypothetical protein